MAPTGVAADAAKCGLSTAQNYYAAFRAGRREPKKMQPLVPRVQKALVSGETFRQLRHLAASTGEHQAHIAGRMLDDMLAIDIPQFLPARVSD